MVVGKQNTTFSVQEKIEICPTYWKLWGVRADTSPQILWSKRTNQAQRKWCRSKKWDTYSSCPKKHNQIRVRPKLGPFQNNFKNRGVACLDNEVIVRGVWLWKPRVAMKKALIKLKSDIWENGQNLFLIVMATILKIRSQWPHL